MTAPDAPDLEPVDPFGATVTGVTDLTPEAKLATADDLAAGRKGITAGQVRAWLVTLSGRVALRLDGWEKLSTEPDSPEARSDREQLVDAARDIVHNGGASYLEAARFPNRAGKAETTYDAVLWQRFEAGLDELAAWLERRLAAPDTGDAPSTVDDIAYDFPPPSFTTTALRF